MPQAEDLRRILEAVDPGLGDIEPEVEVDEQTELADWGRFFPPKGQVSQSGELDYELSDDQDRWRPQFPPEQLMTSGQTFRVPIVGRRLLLTRPHRPTAVRRAGQALS